MVDLFHASNNAVFSFFLDQISSQLNRFSVYAILKLNSINLNDWLQLFYVKGNLKKIASGFFNRQIKIWGFNLWQDEIKNH